MSGFSLDDFTLLLCYQFFPSKIESWFRMMKYMGWEQKDTLAKKCSKSFFFFDKSVSATLRWFDICNIRRETSDWNNIQVQSFSRTIFIFSPHAAIEIVLIQTSRPIDGIVLSVEEDLWDSLSWTWRAPPRGRFGSKQGENLYFSPVSLFYVLHCEYFAFLKAPKY